MELEVQNQGVCLLGCLLSAPSHLLYVSVFKLFLLYDSDHIRLGAHTNDTFGFGYIFQRPVSRQ